MIKETFLREFSKKCELAKPNICHIRGLKSPLVFDMDCICKQTGRGDSVRCDEVVLCDAGTATETTGIYFIENKKKKSKKFDSKKSKNPRVKEIQKQLQSGAKIVEKYLGCDEKFDFWPVLATQNYLPKSFVNELREEFVHIRDMRKKIRIRGKDEEGNVDALPPL